jgi:hypothetical protein
MSTIHTTIEAKILLELTEGEAGALDAICGYGPEKFLEWFKANHGRHYIEKYEGHLVSLFAKARHLNTAVKQLQNVKKEIRTIKC